MNLIVIDPEGWVRWPEVRGYAEHYDIDVAEAVVRLVNAGLSHEPRTYLPGRP